MNSPDDLFDALNYAYQNIFDKYTMSTRAYIGTLNKDGTIIAIYTHNDGYLSHHGPILLEHYNTATKLKKLLALGHLSVLGKKIGEKHDMDNRETRPKDSCVAYGRDRGEAVERDAFKTEEEFCNNREEYGYLFKNNTWFVCHDEHPTLIELTVAFAAERLTA